MRACYALIYLCCFLIVSGPVNALNDLASAAQEIQAKLRINNNHETKDCPYDAPSCYSATMRISLAPSMPKDWRIVFSHLSPILSVESSAFNLQHLNGDLHEITAKQSGLLANTPYEIHFKGNTPLVSESVLFPNYLLVNKAGEAIVIESTKERLLDGHQVPRPIHVDAFESSAQQLRGKREKTLIADAAVRYQQYSSRAANDDTAEKRKEHLNAATIEPRVIPNVREAQYSGAFSNVSNGLDIKDALTDMPGVKSRFDLVGMKLSQNGRTVTFEQSLSMQADAYELLIGAEQIKIKHGNKAGKQNALMTLAQLLNNQQLPIGKIRDQAAMPFRGMHIDVSRNFRSKAFILKLLDQMAYYKLNKLHLHLADDEGWRLEIASLPELTEVGGFRCFDESETECLLPQLASGNTKETNPNNGYYSSEDYIDILRYAHARSIEIIPSLDMPGHSRAAIIAMKARYENAANGDITYLLSEPNDTSQYRSIQHYNDNTLNPCITATYRFVEEVLTQLNTMHKKAGVPLQRYHIGADETAGAWQDSPACNALIANNPELETVKDLGPYFVEKVAQMVDSLGIMAGAWSDGLMHANINKLPKKVHANAWATLYSQGHEKVHKMVNDGWDVVLSLPDVLYFDFPYDADPIEPGYYWGSRNTDTYQIFQFMPFNLPVHAELWVDNIGRPYTATQATSLQANKKVLGIQGQLWSETVRSDDQASYMLFPRLLALAERAWHTPKWAETYRSNIEYSNNTAYFDEAQHSEMQQDWESFTQALSEREMLYLDQAGMLVRVPLPGATIKEDVLHMNTAFKNLVLEYAYEPNTSSAWLTYQGPSKLQKGVYVRSRIPHTQTTSRIQFVPYNPIK